MNNTNEIQYNDYSITLFNTWCILYTFIMIIIIVVMIITTRFVPDAYPELAAPQPQEESIETGWGAALIRMELRMIIIIMIMIII